MLSASLQKNGCNHSIINFVGRVKEADVEWLIGYPYRDIK
jgi:hypothetical protein